MKVVYGTCITHRFIEGEPDMTKEGKITKRNWTCAHCNLQMSLSPPSVRRGVMLFGADA